MGVVIPFLPGALGVGTILLQGVPFSASFLQCISPPFSQEMAYNSKIKSIIKTIIIYNNTYTAHHEVIFEEC